MDEVIKGTIGAILMFVGFLSAIFVGTFASDTISYIMVGCTFAIGVLGTFLTMQNI